MKKLLKGSSLLLSVFFVLTLLIVLGILISIQELNSRQIKSYQKELVIESVVSTGLDMMLASKELEFVKIISADEMVSWNYRRSYWGCFNLFYSEAVAQEIKNEKVCFAGGVIPDFTLAVSNFTDQITISQYVSVDGIVNFNRSDLKMIPVKSDSFDSLFQGSADLRLEETEVNVPINEIDEARKSIRSAIADIHLTESENVISCDVSFKDETRYFLASDTLKNLKICGNAIIVSPGEIVIDSTCHLMDIWVVAKSIIVGDNFKGRMHLAAEESISIGTDSSFEYPSSATLYGEVQGVNQKLIMDDNCNFTGIVLGPKNTKSSLVLSRNGLFEGQLYWPGKAELKGTIKGAAYCGSFFEATDSYFTTDALNGVVLSRVTMNENVLGIGFGTQTKILRWLH